MLWVASLPLFVFAQKANAQPQIFSGPMIGYTEHREVCIWLQTVNVVSELSIHYKPKGSQAPIQKQSSYLFTAKLGEPIITKFILTALEPGVTYEYYFTSKEKKLEVSYPLVFTTRSLWEWRTDPPAFSFLAGSCLYINDSAYDRPGAPYGQSTSILTTMANTPAEIMLWLGDNTYSREVDYSSVYGLKYRYQHTRQHSDLQKLLATKINYAIWDDHDYGTNDACKTYLLKDDSRSLFKEYWANKTYGEHNEGIYTTFSFNDAQFFLLDDRYFRDENDLIETTNRTKSQLGKQQLDWFLQSLLNSQATFKFVCIGGQFLNEYTNKESYNFFKTERKIIIDFIMEHKISGVVFLSGDRHHTELLVNNSVKQNLGYALYDLTSSSITAGPNNKPELDNPMRVEGTLVAENNFCKISISGKRKERKLLISCINREGKVIWERSLLETELKAQK
jgi:alkaline phosphatase D